MRRTKETKKKNRDGSRASSAFVRIVCILCDSQRAQRVNNGDNERWNKRANPRVTVIYLIRGRAYISTIIY